MDPAFTPDAENITLDNGLVEKRGGFIPFIRSQPNQSAVQNAGFHASAREDSDTGSANIDHLIVPGSLLAGHRQIYTDNASAFSIDFVVSPSDLTTTHGGNGQQTATNTGLVSPFTIAVRPILFKGPIKRTLDYRSGISGRPALNYDLSTIWGDGSTEGLPFGIYLYNNSGTWEFRFSFHTKNDGSGVWSLQTITSSIAVEVDQRYHVIVTVNDGDTARLRVAKLGETYVTDTVDLVGESVSTGNRCPIQVFDCPQQFIDTTTTGTTTTRPGLGLSNGKSGNFITGDGTNGTWFFASKRFEGIIEDIVIWKGDLLDGDLTNLDRTGKLAMDGTLPDAATISSVVISYWDMISFSDELIPERSGRDNHFYFSPGGPIDDREAGNPRGGKGWWFNGNSSYAHLTEPGNWDYVTIPASAEAWMLSAVHSNLPHGLRVVIRPDSIEPQGIQVIAEIHTVMRIEINGSGNIQVRVRDGDGASASSDAARGYNYQAVTAGSRVLKPGVRYDISVFRYDSGTGAGKSVAVYVNGQLDVLDDTLTANNAKGSAAGQGGATINTMTLGIGSGGFNNVTNDSQGLPDSRTGGIDQIQTAHHSGYIGRIESVTILGGSPSIILPEQTIYKDESTDDWVFDQQRLWRSPEFYGGLTNEISPNDINDLVANIGTGSALQIFPDSQSNNATPISTVHDLRYNITGDAGTKYQTVTSHVTLSQGGHNTLTQTKARIWHAVGHWYLSSPAGEHPHTGRFVSGLEYYNTGSGSAAPTQRFDYGVWVENTELQDEAEAIGKLTKRCLEPDRPSDTGPTGSEPPEFSHRQRPYKFRSPYELRPKWTEGMLRPRTGNQDISLLADWHHQESGERFVFMASSRQLYWVKPIWRRSSPFESERGIDPDDISTATGYSVWMFGQLGEHIRALPSDPNQEYSSALSLDIEIWLHPTRLDGTRLIAFSGDPTSADVANAAHANFAIFTVDGSVHVLGTMSSDTKTWHYSEAVLGGSTVYPEARLRVNSWNHLHVRIRTAGSVELRINGEFAALHDYSTSGSAADAMTPASVDETITYLYLGGLPRNNVQQTFTVTAGGPDLTYTFQSWHGYMTEFRVQNAEDTTTWPVGESGIPPKDRFTLTQPPDTWLIHLNQGSGWGVENVAWPEGANLEVSELILVKGDLSESKGYRYDFAVFRDELLITNGRSFPHRVQFTRYSDPDGPFRCYRLGILEGFSVEATVTALTVAEAGAQTNLANGVYSVYVSFVNAKGDESDPYLLGTLNRTSGNFSAVDLENVPRSDDPQVTGRRYYVPASGGGTALIHSTIYDNDSGDVELYDGGAGESVPTAGTRLPAPKAKHLAVGGGTTFLGNLPDVAAGQNTFTFARVDNGMAEYLADGVIIIDSQDGNPITGMINYLGRLYLFKRDSSWQFSLFGTGDPTNGQAYLRNINPSEGAGGGVTVYGNVIYGSGDRGVYRFDGANTGYASQMLEGEWGDVDVTDYGLINQHGSYHWPNSQYWLSVRLLGDLSNTRVYVLDASPNSVIWVKMDLPPHTYLATLIDPVTQTPRLLVGTTSGQILRYEEDTVIEGHDGGRQDSGSVTLSGTSGTLATTSLSGVSGLDLIGPGLRGVTVTIAYAYATGSATEVRTIESNTSTSLSWITPLSNTPTGITSWVIGAYTAYWTSPWLAPQTYGRYMVVRRIDLDFQPDSTTLSLQTRRPINEPITQAFDTSSTGSASFSQDLTNGFQDQPIDLTKVRGHARYIRIRFATTGINDKFRVSGWGVRYDESLAKGGIRS